jgi:hypothetical protein
LSSGSKLTFAAKDTDFERGGFLAGSCAGSEDEFESSSEPVDPARPRRSKSDGNLSVIMSFCNPASLVGKVCWLQEGK